MATLLKKLEQLEDEIRWRYQRPHKVETVYINAGDPRPPRGEGVFQICCVIVDPPADGDAPPLRDRHQLVWDPITPSPPSPPPPSRGLPLVRRGF